MPKNPKKGVRRMRLRDVSGSYTARAYRIALRPLIKATYFPDPTKPLPKSKKAQILHQHKALLDVWRGRLQSLTTGGWATMSNSLDYVWAANCPPAGVMTQYEGMRSCRRHQFCPWCWCRHRVRDVFHRLNRAMYVPGESEPLPLDLVEVRTDRYYPSVGPKAWTAREVIEYFIKEKGNLYKKNMSEALGGLVLCSLEPPRQLTEIPCFTVQHRVLALVRHDDLNEYDIPCNLGDFPGDGGAWADRSVDRYQMPRTYDLAKIAGRFAEYPVRMMTSDVKAALDVYNALTTPSPESKKGKPRRGSCTTRLSATYGVLRGKLTLPDEENHDEIQFSQMGTGHGRRGTSGAKTTS